MSQERRQSGVPTIMESETGVGQTKLLMVYHELVSGAEMVKTRREEALLGLLQHFETEHQELLLDTAQLQPVARSTGFGATMAAMLHRPLAPPVAPLLPVTDQIKQLREEGVEVYGLHSVASQIVTTLSAHETDDSSEAVCKFVTRLLIFVAAEVESDRMLDTDQLEYILHTLLTNDDLEAVMKQAAGAVQAYKVSAAAWQAAPHGACWDQHVQDALAGGDANTPHRSELVLQMLASLLSCSRRSSFEALQMHAQITPAAMWAKLRPFSSLAKSCPEQQFTFFVDELNTSSMMGEMKNIFMDGTFDGIALPSNIFWVAAINPSRPESAPQHADGTQSYSSRYAVHPCPASMVEVVWAFGNMSAANEKDYVTAKLQMVAAQGTGSDNFSEATCRFLMRYIMQAQVCNT